MQALTTGTAAVNENARAFEDAAHERMEYALDQKRQQLTQEIASDIDRDIMRRLQLPDGHRDSFWDANGIYDDQKYLDYVQSQQARFNGLEKGYLREEAQRRASESIETIKSKIRDNIGNRVSAALTPRAKAATERNAAAAAARGDFAAAIATIQGAPDYAFNQTEKDLLSLGYQQEASMDAAQKAIDSGDPSALLTLIGDSKFMSGLTPANRAKILKAANHFMPGSSSLSGVNTADAAAAKNGKASASSAKDPKPYPELPYGVPVEVYHLYHNTMKDKGGFTDGRDQEEARKKLREWGFAAIHPENAEEMQQKLAISAKLFGIPDAESFAAQIAKSRLNDLKGVGTFSMSKFLNERPATFFSTPEKLNQIQSLKKERDALRSQATSGMSKKKWDKLKGQIAQIDNRIKWAEEAYAEEKNQQTAAILAEYAQWQEAHPDASAAQCTLTAIDILEKHRTQSSKDQYNSSNSLLQQAQEEEEKEKAKLEEAKKQSDAIEENAKVIDAERKQLDAEAKLKKEQEEQQKEQEEALLPKATFDSYESARMDTTLAAANKLKDTTSAAYLAVPKGSPYAGKNLVVGYGSQARIFECREADVQNPTLSLLAQMQFGILGQPSSAEIIFNGKGRAIIKQNNAPYTGQMYKFMIDAEAQRDKKGNIKIYTPPAGDGGGAGEVAGINERYHPAEYKKLAAMVRNGTSNEELESEIASYYQYYTQSTADILSTCGIESEGIEYFLRDTAFNLGNGGAAAVMRNALGIPTGASIPQALYAYSQSHTKEDLLKRLCLARQARYNTLAQKPGKEQFSAGWRNRNNTAYQNALAIL